MTGRPWMPLYIADYLADTAHLGALQSGAYMHLIMHYWQHGGLPDNDAALTRIARLTPAEWRRERPVLVAFFHDGWKHKRIDAELAHAAEVTSKRSEAASNRWGKRPANASGNGQGNAGGGHVQKDTHSHSPSKDILLSENKSGALSVAVASLINGAAKKINETGMLWLKWDDTRVPVAKAWWRKHYDAELPVAFNGRKQGYRVPYEAVAIQ